MKDILKWLVLGGLFLIPFLTLYVENNFFFPYITGKNFAFRILVEVVFFSWLVLALSDKQYRPRWSWILGSFSIFMGVLLIANLQAININNAFWSNYERMDGYVTIIHVFLYFLVLGTMLRTPKIWSYFLHTSVMVAGFVALKGLSQLTGASVRVDSTLGNAAYMAVYMLFHIFILFYLFVRTNVNLYRIAYVLLSLLFMFVLLQTGTRGTAIGLVIGVIVATGYIAIFGARYKTLQKYAIGSFIFLFLTIGGFMAVKDSSYIQNSSSLARIANIDLSKDLTIRSIIWGMAKEGFKERPILGWGQGNFNYVFNTQYDPRMYAQEQWFDRVHNIVFDWLIAGGALGLLTYFSIFGALGYYLFWKPIFKPEESFNVLERGVLLGLIVGYLTHNLVVFDNIVSYIFFGTIIALIHSRVATDIKAVANVKISPAILTQVILPIVILIGGVTIYFVNIPSLLAAGDIIDAMRSSNDKEAQLANFELALGRGSFAQQEIVEQFVQLAMNIGKGNDKSSQELITTFQAKAEMELLKLIENKPNDARLYVFLGSYYRAINNLPKAKEALATARTLSPRKQAIILQQGAVELGMGNTPAARDFFKEAFLLDENYNDAREYYVAALFMTKEGEEAKKIIDEAPVGFENILATSDFVTSAVNTAGDFSFLAELYEIRLKQDPSSAKNWASLAFVYYQLQENDQAVDALKRAKEAIPNFAPTANCISENILAGREPQKDCK